MKNKLGIITILILTVALVAGLVLVRRNQDARKSAYFAQSRVYLMPTEFEMNVGEEKMVHLYVDTGSIVGGDGELARIQSIQTQICFSDKIAVAVENSRDNLENAISYNAENGFEDVALARLETTDEGRNCLNLAIVSDSFDNLKSGVVDVGSIKFKGVVEGGGTISITQDKTTVSGENVNDSLDKEIKVETVEGVSFQIKTGGVEPTITVEPTVTEAPTGNWPVLNFKVAFRDIKAEAKCGLGDQNKVSIIALAANGTKKAYENVAVIKTDEKNSDGMGIYQGRIELRDFNYMDNVAIFVKGPRDLQWKYGKNNQDGFYDKAGGELTGLTKDENSPVKDFSEFPLIPGDISGATEGVQDGQIDGRDFSLVKARGAPGVKADDGTFVLTDLDGDCMTISLDYIHLLNSIKEKQEQIY